MGDAYEPRRLVAQSPPPTIATLLWRIVLTAVYAVVTALVGYGVTRALLGDDDESSSPTAASPWPSWPGNKARVVPGVSRAHADAIRACVAPPSDVALGDVGGLDAAKDELRRAVVLPLAHASVFFAPSTPPSLRPPRGVLLHGPPGTGKTMLARAVAAEANVPLVALTSATLESKWWGESSKLVRAAFRVARHELQPCVVFFDEIDGMGGRTRSELDQACVYSLKTELLRNLDGVDDDKHAAVLVLACTNCPRALDPALRRRFARAIEVAPPDEAARRTILRKLTACDDVDRVAKSTAGWTGADLAALHARASAARFDGASLASALHTAGDDPDAVARAAGPLRAAHWEAAGVRWIEEEEAPPTTVGAGQGRVSARTEGASDTAAQTAT
jgi:hypothetical protein